MLTSPASLRRHRAPHASRARRGGVPAWLPLALLAAGVVAWQRGLAERVQRTGFGRVEASQVRADLDQPWADPRWSLELRQVVADGGTIDPEDGAALEALRARLAALSFVRDATLPRVLWPDGLELSVRLRRPVACVAWGDAFLLVDDQGVLLSGAWDVPPSLDGMFLPVLGERDGALDSLRPGDALVERRHLDALSIARSLWEHVDPSWGPWIGRLQIVADDVDLASVEIPGAVLRLEGGREAWFGRSPNKASAGELPVPQRWSNLVQVLERTADSEGAVDWAVADLRFDRPALSARVDEPR
ncbi:MAG: cell division protein FtsQ/DivIB [Planctomycetota bacterium]|jgi:hypothetical protein